MYVLDTNVISELMKFRPVQRVFDWVAMQPFESLFTTSITRAEILSGIATLPKSRRRADLEAAANVAFSEDFEDRILPFDAGAAVAYAEIFAARRSAGRPIATLDLMIASVARSQTATIVTRDVGGFAGCGVDLVDPWRAASG